MWNVLVYYQVNVCHYNDFILALILGLRILAFLNYIPKHNTVVPSRSFDTAKQAPLPSAATNKIVSYLLNVIFVIEFSGRGREAPRHKHRELVILPVLRWLYSHSSVEPTGPTAAVARNAARSAGPSTCMEKCGEIRVQHYDRHSSFRTSWSYLALFLTLSRRPEQLQFLTHHKPPRAGGLRGPFATGLDSSYHHRDQNLCNLPGWCWQIWSCWKSVE